MSLADVADLLACPACAARGREDSPLALSERTLRCPEGHAYDVARQGHVNLLGRAVPRNADTAEMVAARERFLGGGAYDAVADALSVAVLDGLPGGTDAPVVLDVGAGPGWYLERVLAHLGASDRVGRGLALDVSPLAARRAARSSARLGAVVADAWGRWPVRSATVDAALSVFAPRRPDELARVLASGGVAVVVSPLPEHLAGLRASRGLLDVEPGKQERLAATFREHLRPLDETDVRRTIDLRPAAVDDLVAMGPNAFHHAQASPAAATREGAHDASTADGTELAELTEVEIAVRVSRWSAP